MHSDPATTGSRRPYRSDSRPPIGAAMAPSPEIPSRTRPAVCAVPAEGPLDEERHQDEAGMQDDGGAQHAEHGRGEWAGR